MSAQRAKQRVAGANALAQNGLGNSAQELAALLSSSDAFHHLRQIEVENRLLRERNKALEITNNTNMDTITKKVNELTAQKTKVLEELEKERAVAKSLHEMKVNADRLRVEIKTQEDLILSQAQTIKGKDAEITRQENTCRQKGIELDKEKSTSEALGNTLETTQENLKRCTKERDLAEASLATLQSFDVQLEPMAKLKTQIQTALADLFRHFFELFVSELSSDVDDDVAIDEGIEKLRLPLPRSNSAAAKQMRIAAGLCVAGVALTRHVFRQTFLTSNRDLDKMLSLLVREHADQERHVRAVLLGVMPEAQLKNQGAGVNGAVEEIVTALLPWLSEPETFLSGLRSLCEEANGVWNLILKVEIKVEPNFLPQVPGDWQPLPPMLVKAASKSTTVGQNKVQAKTPKQQPATTSSASCPAKLSKNQVALAVWPIFLARSLDNGRKEMVSHGYVLTKGQIQDAEEEVSREEFTYEAAKQVDRPSIGRRFASQKKNPNTGFLST